MSLHQLEQISSEAFVDIDGDLDFLNELDAFIDDEILMEHQEVVAENDEDLLMSVISEAESDDEMAELYKSQEQEVVTTIEIVEVAGEPVVILEAAESVALAEEEVVKIAKGHKSRASKPSDRITTRLGADAVDFTTLTPEWAIKSTPEHVEDFAKVVDSMALYVSDKAVNLFAFLKTGGGLNAVTHRGFEVLIRDGQLVGGEKGNIVQNLLSKPYSLGTASSQSNQLLQLFTDLEIGIRTARGVVAANPDSIILERVKTILGK